MTYPTLTDKAAKDFGVIPGLATKWEGSEDGKTWTYTLRPGMKWSDGQPLTAEDVAYTINRSRDEEWLNHSATTANLTATATSPTEVVIKSKVPDPKLPTMDVYIVPKHIYEQYDAKALTKWNGQTDVAGGPYQLAEFKKGQFARFTANPNFWGGKPSVDEVVIRKFNNADAMVAGAQARRGRLRPERPRGPVPQPPEGSRLRHAGGPPGRLRRVRHQHGRRPQEAAPGAARPEGPRGDRPRDRQEDDRRPRAARDRRAGRGASARPRTRTGPRTSPRTSGSTSTSRSPSRSSRTRATRTPTATASARCRAAASR